MSIVYSVDYQGIQSCLLPTLSRLSVSSRPDGRLRHRCSSAYLRISPLLAEFRHPLRHSSSAVSDALPWLSHGLSHLTCQAAYTLFTPNNSEQRLHPPYYRGCWHGVSRGLRMVPSEFFPCLRSLHPERFHPSRGVAASGFRPLRKIPHCCLP